MKLKIGSRGSRLALAQTKWVAEKIKEKYPSCVPEIVVIQTKGDQILDKALDKIGDKGLFVKEIEKALLKGEIDCAVHSMKDMPTESMVELSLASIPKREDNQDVLILRKEYQGFENLPRKAVIGTGSKRRMYQIGVRYPEFSFKAIRGNIETRIKKLESGEFDGIVLAAAGLHRLNLEAYITIYLEKEVCVPAPAQGALALQYRTGDVQIKAYLESIKNEQATLEVQAERAFLKYTEGGCHTPVGAYTIIEGDKMILYGLLGLEDGSRLVFERQEGSKDKGEELGKQLARKVLKELYDGR